MAKSKEQTQLEAIQRKRKGIHVYRETWMKYAHGTESRQKLLQNHTEAKLNDLFERADIALKKACKEAQVDLHGNPLPGSPGYNDPGLLLDPDAMVKVNRQFVDRSITERVVGSHRHEPILSSGSFDKIKHNLDFDGDEPLVPLFSTEQIQKEINRLREQAVLLRKAPYFNFEKAKAFEAEATRIERLL